MRKFNALCPSSDRNRHNGAPPRLAKLLLAVLCFFLLAAGRLLLPELSVSVRALLFGNGTLEQSIYVFYASIRTNGSMPKAISALCDSLDDAAH